MLNRTSGLQTDLAGENRRCRSSIPHTILLCRNECSKKTYRFYATKDETQSKDIDKRIDRLRKKENQTAPNKDAVKEAMTEESLLLQEGRNR